MALVTLMSTPERRREDPREWTATCACMMACCRAMFHDERFGHLVAAVIREQLQNERHVTQERAAKERRAYLDRRGARLTDKAKQLGEWEERLVAYRRYLAKAHIHHFDH